MVMVGETAQLTASSVRTSEEYSSVVTSTEEHPIDYIWSTSDASVLAVSTSGLIQGVSEGKATITCTLAQNPSQSVSFDVEVQGDMTAPHLAFTNTVPATLGLYKTATINAAYYEDGAEVTGAEIVWTFGVADEDSYTVTREGNTITVKCWSGSVYPLRIVASYAGKSVAADIDLEGI